MNNYTLALLLLLSASRPLVLQAQSAVKQKAQPAQDRKQVELLCHTWNFDISSAPAKVFPVDSFSTVEFKTNGYLTFAAKTATEGVWNFDSARHDLYIIASGNLFKYKVISLTENEMVIEYNLNKKLVNMHLFRKSM